MCGCNTSSSSSCGPSCDIKSLDPISACAPASGKFSVQQFSTGAGGSQQTTVYTGVISDDSGPCAAASDSLDEVMITSLADIIQTSIDPTYVAPIPVDGTPVFYGPLPGSITLAAFTTYLQNAANNPGQTTAVANNIACLAATVFVGLRAAARHALTVGSGGSICGGGNSFGYVGGCKSKIDVRIN